MINYALASRRFDIFQGVNLNLNFPSKVGTIKAGERDLDYGYSSGIYTKYVSTHTPVQSLPTQDDIDASGGGKSMRAWEERFELAYRQCHEQNVTLVGGVAPTALQFGRFLKRKYHTYPKKLWNVIIMTLGSIPGINTRLAEPLQALYGNAAIREIYGSPKGCSGSNWMKNEPGRPTTTCSSSKSRRPAASSRCTKCGGGNGQLDRFHPHLSTLQDGRPDTCIPRALLPLHRAGELADAPQIRLVRIGNP